MIELVFFVSSADLRQGGKCFFLREANCYTPSGPRLSCLTRLQLVVHVKKKKGISSELPVITRITYVILLRGSLPFDTKHAFDLPRRRK